MELLPGKKGRVLITGIICIGILMLSMALACGCGTGQSSGEKPTITDVASSKSDTGGESTYNITITGEKFGTGTGSVQFTNEKTDVEVVQQAFISWDDNRIECGTKEIDLGDGGQWEVTVTTSAEQVSEPFEFTSQ